MMLSSEVDVLSWFARFQPEMATKCGHSGDENRFYIEADGRYTLAVNGRQYGYRLQIQVPFPAMEGEFPTVICTDEKLYPNLDRHILGNRAACLGTPLDIHLRLGREFTFPDFAENIVNPFIAWQLYYDIHGQPPPQGGRSHGVKGKVESFSEYLSKQWHVPYESVFNCLYVHKYKGCKPCICGSGKQFWHCHGSLIQALSETIQDLKKVEWITDESYNPVYLRLHKQLCEIEKTLIA